MSNFKHVTHCIFDMDGLLIDTEGLYTTAINLVLQTYNKEFTWQHKAQTMGSHSHQMIRYLIDTFELPLEADEIAKLLQNYYLLLFPTAKMMPGAERLLRHLKKHNIPIAMASSSSQESFELKTDHLTEVFNLFHHRVLGGSDPEVKVGKPNPDIFLVAAKRFDDSPDPSKCLVFEDAPNGVEAGLSAGMQTVMVPDPNLPKHFSEKATLVLSSLKDFKPELFGLPKFD